MCRTLSAYSTSGFGVFKSSEFGRPSASELIFKPTMSQRVRTLALPLQFKASGRQWDLLPFKIPKTPNAEGVLIETAPSRGRSNIAARQAPPPTVFANKPRLAKPSLDSHVGPVFLPDEVWDERMGKRIGFIPGGRWARLLRGPVLSSTLGLRCDGWAGGFLSSEGVDLLPGRHGTVNRAKRLRKLARCVRSCLMFEMPRLPKKSLLNPRLNGGRRWTPE